MALWGRGGPGRSVDPVTEPEGKVGPRAGGLVVPAGAEGDPGATGVAAAAPRPSSTLSALVQWAGGPVTFQVSVLTVALIGLCCMFAVISPGFFTLNNQLDNLENASYVGIIAFGQTLVIIAGEIDISVGSATALASALIGVLTANLGLPIGLAIALVLGEASVVGALSGFVRARFAVPSFIITLATYTGLRGIALLITNAYPIAVNSTTFAYWGQGKIASVPVPAVILIIVFVLLYFVASRTVFGRYVYAVGGDAEAARRAGVPVMKIRIAVLALTGFLAGAVGIIETARLSSADPTIAVGLEFQTIAAVIIGGTRLAGGRGSMFGTLVGILFITVLSNGMVLLGINSYAQDVMQGGIILVAVLMTSARRDRA